MREDFGDLECSSLVHRKMLIVQCKTAFAMNFFFVVGFRKTLGLVHFCTNMCKEMSLGSGRVLESNDQQGVRNRVIPIWERPNTAGLYLGEIWRSNNFPIFEYRTRARQIRPGMRFTMCMAKQPKKEFNPHIHFNQFLLLPSSPA